MNIDIQILSWDSDFFDIKIGKVTQSQFTSQDLDHIYKGAKQQGFRLLYIVSNNRLSFARSCRGDLILVDIKTSLRVRVTNTTHAFMRWSVVEYDGLKVTPELEQLAYESGVYSRFHVDDKFPDTLFKKLYKKWIQNSIRKKSADMVFVCLNNRMKPIGFVTVKQHKDTSHIGLISVAKQYRKKHIGSSLLQQAIQWSHMKQCKYMTITTQFDNTSAMNLYKRCGFKITEKIYYYHYWI